MEANENHQALTRLYGMLANEVDMVWKRATVSLQFSGFIFAAFCLVISRNFDGRLVLSVMLTVLGFLAACIQIRLLNAAQIYTKSILDLIKEKEKQNPLWEDVEKKRLDLYSEHNKRCVKKLEVIFGKYYNKYLKNIYEEGSVKYTSYLHYISAIFWIIAFAISILSTVFGTQQNMNSQGS